MDVKQYQDSFDPLEGRIKTEPDIDIVSIKTTEQKYSIKSQSLKNEQGDVPDDSFNFLEFQYTEKFVNSDEIKQEIVECEMPKIEDHSLDLPTKADHSMVCDNVPTFSMAIKKEPKNTNDFHEVKAEDLFVDINKLEIGEYVFQPKNESDFRGVKEADIVDISVVNKPEVSDFIQPKNESELLKMLNTHCDLPTLKDECSDYTDYFTQPNSSKQSISKVISKKKRRRYECPVCQMGFPSSKSRSTHINEHFGKGFVVCRFCGKLFKKIEFLLHSFIHTVKNKTEIFINDQPIKCNLFSKELKQTNFENVKDKSTLRRNLIIHKKLFKCDFCFKTFNLKTNLQKHLITHRGGKPFQCDSCSKTFAQKSHLQKHLIIHTNENPFKCDVCCKSFNDKSSLTRHLIIHSGEKPFKCDICSKEFALNYILKQHLLIHSGGEKSFKCNICSKKFTQISYLNQHLITHAVKKPFKCDVCSKNFKRKSYLQAHLVIHTNEKPFKCDNCFKTFTQKSSLNRHVIIRCNK